MKNKFAFAFAFFNRELFFFWVSKYGSWRRRGNEIFESGPKIGRGAFQISCRPF